MSVAPAEPAGVVAAKLAFIGEEFLSMFGTPDGILVLTLCAHQILGIKLSVDPLLVNE